MITPLQYNDIPWLLAVFFLLLSVTLIAFRPGGLGSVQFQWLRSTRNARVFSADRSTTAWGVSLMILSCMFLFGLMLFCALKSDAPALLSRPTVDTLLEVGFCMLPPLGWFLIQWFFINWTGYLFGLGDSIVIFNRIYLAVEVLAVPFLLLLFAVLILVPIPSKIVLILLTTLFILTQIVCIFFGIKIFLKDYTSALLIFLYLCTLEIAPLLVLYTKWRSIA